MDINEAAIELKKLEIVQEQLKHLQDEAKNSPTIDYAEDCNARAQELIKLYIKPTNH